MILDPRWVLLGEIVVTIWRIVTGTDDE